MAKKSMKKGASKMKMASGSMSKKMSPQERFKMMAEARKKKAGGKQKASITAKKPKKVGSTKNKLSGGGYLKPGKKQKMTSGSKKKGMKMSITAKKAKVVKHKKKGRV